MRGAWVFITGAGLAYACSLSECVAMDCNKASTPIEHAICGNASLRAQDAALSKLYFSTLKAFSGARHDLLIEDQKTWIRSRTKACAAEKTGVADCLAKSTADRESQIAACFAKGAPNPSATNLVCPVAEHRACPEFTVSAVAGVWAYPFLKARLDDVVTQTLRDSLEKDTCAPEGPGHPGDPDQVQDDFTMTIVGSGVGWVATKEETFSMGRGAAHQEHSESVTSFDGMGQELPIETLMPALKQAPEASKLWNAANEHLSVPCCGDDEKASLDDLHLNGKGEAKRPLPNAWSLDGKGNLTLFYQFTTLGRDFVAEATIRRAVYIGWVADKYRPWFASAQ